MLSVEKLLELGKLADFSGEGKVSYMEILTALQPPDTALGGHVRFDLFDRFDRFDRFGFLRDRCAFRDAFGILLRCAIASLIFS